MSTTSSIDQNEAVLTQIGQQLEAQANTTATPLIINLPLQTASTPQIPKVQTNPPTLTSSRENKPPLLLEIVDPEQPPKRGRPKGVKSHSFPESQPPKTSPLDMGSMISKMRLNEDSTKKGKVRPQLKLVIPPQPRSFTPIKMAPSTVPVKAAGTPLPEWKVRLKDKLLKRSMSVEKLPDKNNENHPSGSQTAQVLMITTTTTTATNDPLIISRPPLKRQSSVHGELEPRTKSARLSEEMVDNAEVRVVIAKANENSDATVKMMVNEEKEDKVKVTINEEEKTITLIHLGSGDKTVAAHAGPSQNVTANIVLANDIVVVSADELPPNNNISGQLTYCDGVAAPAAKFRPKTLPVLELTSDVAKKIPSLLPDSGAKAKLSVCAAEGSASINRSESEATFSVIVTSGTPVTTTTEVAAETGRETSEAASSLAVALPQLSRSVSKPAPPPCTELYSIPEDLHDKATIVYLLLGHSYPVLASEPATTFCSLLKPQPMYVELSNSKISMYSNWRTVQSLKVPLDLGIREFLSLHQTRRSVMEESITVNAGRDQPHHMTYSSNWKEQNEDKEKLKTEKEIVLAPQMTTEVKTTEEEQEVVIVDESSVVFHPAQNIAVTESKQEALTVSRRAPNIPRASQQDKLQAEYSLTEVCEAFHIYTF